MHFSSYLIKSQLNIYLLHNPLLSSHSKEETMGKTPCRIACSEAREERDCQASALRMHEIVKMGNRIGPLMQYNQGEKTVLMHLIIFLCFPSTIDCSIVLSTCCPSPRNDYTSLPSDFGLGCQTCSFALPHGGSEHPHSDELRNGGTT